ncbi:MAG: YqgE/AlgH family protein, partial [Rhodothermales bacterium]
IADMISSPFRPAPGRFLVSEPFMGDPNFQRSVVLLTEHNDQGSLGFVLNRQIEAGVHDLIEEVPKFDAPVFLGGPVEQNTLHYLHRLGERLPHSHHIANDVYWSGDFDLLTKMISDNSISEDEILFFVGYSGWGPGQLEKELEQKSWIVAPETDEFVFMDEYDGLWQQVLGSMGGKYRVLSNYPVDPQLN